MDPGDIQMKHLSHRQNSRFISKFTHPENDSLALYRNYRKLPFILAALVIISFVYVYGLDRPLLWGDEADTGVFARNVLRFGYPVAYDGRNVTVCSGEAQVSKDLLVEKYIPWVQHYLAAISLASFGDSTRGLRLIFAIIGVISFFPIYQILKTRVKFPIILTLLILTSPQVVLFQRSARYYSVLILLFALLVWHLTTNFRRSRPRFFIASLYFIILFHTHPFAALCISVSLILFCLILRKKEFLWYLVSSGIGFFSWFMWFMLLGPTLGGGDSRLIIITHPEKWLELFLSGLRAAVLDLDTINYFPVILWAVLIAAIFFKNRKSWSNFPKDPIAVFILLSLLVQITAAAACFGYESAAKYSLLRYMPHLITFALVPLFIMLNSLIKRKTLFIAACVLIILSNFLTLSYWAKPQHRSIPVSWWPPVYSEIFQPSKNVWDNVIEIVDNKAPQTADRHKTIAALPKWVREIPIFYLGDQFLIVPPIKRGSETELDLRKFMGDKSFSRFTKQPEWIIDILGRIKGPLPGYKVFSIPSYRARPDDGTRPELTRHTFPQADITGYSRIYQVVK